jgi:Bacterial SH3 domain
MPRIPAFLVLTVLALMAACSSTSQSPTPAATPVARVTVPAASSPSVVQSSPSAAAAASSPSPAATALPPPTVPSPTPASPATSTPVAAARMIWVANTDGGGVYLRNSPHDGDRADVLADNTALTVIGELVEGDGRNWWPVRTQNGMDGYVPEAYTTQTDPQAPPAPLVPNQAK